MDLHWNTLYEVAVLIGDCRLYQYKTIVKPPINMPINIVVKYFLY